MSSVRPPVLDAEDPVALVLAAEERFDKALSDARGEAADMLAKTRAMVVTLEAEGAELVARDITALEEKATASRIAAVAALEAELGALVSRFDAVEEADVERLSRWVARRVVGIEEAPPSSGSPGDQA